MLKEIHEFENQIKVLENQIETSKDKRNQKVLHDAHETASFEKVMKLIEWK